MRLILSALLFMPALVVASPEAVELVGKMRDALIRTNYMGTFVYMNGRDMETMYVAHEWKDGMERSHIRALSGTPREVLRDQKYVTCVWPEDRAAVKEPISADREFELPIPADTTALEEYYKFSLAKNDRIAGQPCQSVIVAPLDNYRFGYEYCVDQSTGMPLRIQTINAEGATIEQLVFTDISFPESISDERFALSSDIAGYEIAEAAASSKWNSGSNLYKFKGLPIGFKVDSFVNQPASETEPGFHQLVLSDGLAKVSLFISEYVHEQPMQGKLKSGAVHVMSTNRDGHELTAVGEVPERTLQVVLDTIQIPQ